MSNINPKALVDLASASVETGIHFVNILPLLEHRKRLAVEHFRNDKDELLHKEEIYYINNKISKALGLNPTNQ